MGPVMAFWAVALLIAALALPIAFTLFRRFPDAGAGLSFPLGLALVGFGYFTLRVASVLPAGRAGYVLAVALFALLSATVAARDRRFWATLRRSLPALMITAGLFTLAFFAYVAFRSFRPDVAGTEQPMDFMYLNATLESPAYPPHDPWLAGQRASYYYFGYLQVGVLTAVSGVKSSVGYNLGLAYTFAAAATAIASLVAALTRCSLGRRGRKWAVPAAGVAVVMLLGVGSLSAVFEWAAAHGHYNRDVFELMGVEWLIPCEPGVTGNCFSGPADPRTTAWYPTEYWFWWRGTRIIPDTITEFPFFSFMLGDLHPHVMAIPLVLLALGLSAATWRGRSLLRLQSHLRSPFTGVVLALLLGALAFQNAWDLLTFSGAFALAVLVRNLRAAPPGRALVATAGYLGPLFALAVVAYLPWYLDFSSQASGLYPYAGRGTRPAHAFLQFGPLLLAGLLTLVPAARPFDRDAAARFVAHAAWVLLLPMALWVALTIYHHDLSEALQARRAGGWVTLGAYGAATWALVTAFLLLAWQRRAAALPTGMAAAGALLLFGAELFLIRDVFFGGTPRLNTVFKLTYQAWVLLSVAGAVGLATAIRDARTGHAPGWLAVPVGALLVAGLAYPLTAAPNRTEGFSGGTAIDGLAFLARDDPSEYALTRWVHDHTAPGDIILEATGRAWRRDENGRPVIYDSRIDYTDAGRIAARTGRQTLIGWYSHEIQWRGDTEANRKEFNRRQDLVDSAYTSPDPLRAVEVMKETGARYLVVGRVELSRYAGDIMPPFETVLEIAFESGGLRVYRLPEGGAGTAR